MPSLIAALEKRFFIRNLVNIGASRPRRMGDASTLLSMIPPASATSIKKAAMSSCEVDDEIVKFKELLSPSSIASSATAKSSCGDASTSSAWDSGYVGEDGEEEEEEEESYSSVEQGQDSTNCVIRKRKPLLTHRQPLM
jgi:hypothetical protein